MESNAHANNKRRIISALWFVRSNKIIYHSRIAIEQCWLSNVHVNASIKMSCYCFNICIKRMKLFEQVNEILQTKQ